jgi:hypothetical protein
MESFHISTTGIGPAIEKEYDRVFSPISALQHGMPIEFHVVGTSLFYISLKDSYFDIKFKITNPDGSNLDGAATVGPVNLVSHAIFKNIELSLNGKQISEPTNNYPYRAYIETLLNYTSNVQEKRLVVEGWAMDTAGHFAATNAHDGDNTALVSRKAWITTSHSVRMIFHPSLDIFHQDGDIPPNTDIKIRLLPNDETFFLMANVDNEAYHFSLQSIHFWARTHEVCSSYLLAQQAQLHSGLSYLIKMPSVKIKTLSIPTGSVRVELDNIYMGQLPHRIILGLVQADHMNGTWQSNPFHFQHYGVTSLMLKVNGEQIPRDGYNPLFTDETDYIRDYFQVLQALDLDTDTAHAFSLTPTEWASGSTLFAFKLFPNQSSLHRSGTVKLEMRFGAQTPHIITIILLSESTSSIEIDKYKNILEK